MSDTIKGKVDRVTGKAATIHTPPEDIVSGYEPVVLVLTLLDPSGERFNTPADIALTVQEALTDAKIFRPGDTVEEML